MNIIKPTLLLSKDIAIRNIKRLSLKTKDSDVQLTPHFKTHQSMKVGRWFKEEGINQITVSSVSMAEYFADAGWLDITIAFPVNILEISKISALASRVELTLLLTNLQQANALIEHVAVFTNVLIEVDAGSRRSGLAPENDKIICELIDKLRGSQHHFKGFYSHFGHTYRATNLGNVEEIYLRSLNIMQGVQHRHADVQPLLSIGDTPSTSVIKDFSTISSFHAGNFVFYDLTQEKIGVCTEEDIAIALACPIVNKSDVRNEAIIYGGGVHLSKESLYDDALGIEIFGRLVLLTEKGWSTSQPGCYLRSISQEHGVLILSEELFDELKVGDVIGILPVHSCMTADCMRGYTTLEGEEIDHFGSL